MDNVQNFHYICTSTIWEFIADWLPLLSIGKLYCFLQYYKVIAWILGNIGPSKISLHKLMSAIWHTARPNKPQYSCNNPFISNIFSVFVTQYFLFYKWFFIYSSNIALGPIFPYFNKCYIFFFNCQRKKYFFVCFCCYSLFFLLIFIQSISVHSWQQATSDLEVSYNSSAMSCSAIFVYQTTNVQ